MAVIANSIASGIARLLRRVAQARYAEQRARMERTGVAGVI